MDIVSNAESGAGGPFGEAPGRADAHGRNLEAALALARAGYAVFPAGTDKRPLIRWLGRSTTDAATIRGWWDKYPSAVPALPCGKVNGVAVLDVDRKKGKDGFAALQAMGVDVDALSHMRVDTPSGGAHLFFKWSEGLGNSADKLAFGADVRAEGGYVIAPGAVMPTGEYRYAGATLGADVLDLPKWPDSLRALGADKAPLSDQRSSDRAPAPSAELLRKAVEALPNNAGHFDSRDEWVQVGHAIKGAVASTEFKELGRDLWLDFCARWDGESDAVAAERFWDSCHSPHSSWRGLLAIVRRVNPGAAEDIRQEEARAEFEPVRPHSRGPSDWIEHDERGSADLEEFWRVDDLMPFEGLGVLYGQPGCGKTFLALDLGLSVATGRTWMGQAVEQCPVVYVASEGGRRAARNRIVGWQSETGISDTSAFECVAANFALPAGAGPLITAIKERGVSPGFVIVDTLGQNFGGANENDASDMGSFVVQMKRVQRELRCFILVLHHSGKDPRKGARGHNSLFGAVDFEATIDSDNASDSASDRWLTVTKNRDGLAGQSIGFRLKRVVLGRSTKEKDVTTCVALPLDAQVAETWGATEGRRKAMAGRSEQQTWALEILERHEKLVQDFEEVSHWTRAQWVQEYIRNVAKTPERGLAVPSRGNATTALKRLIENDTPAVRVFDGDRVAPIYGPGFGSHSGTAEPDDAADD